MIFKVLPIAVHGDAAVAGQGILYEIVQMAQLDGYKTGGTIHIIVTTKLVLQQILRCPIFNLLYRCS
jgi:2-oxoglutarate dehydrogenase complex dehydrogenase (E1) component-like enzyme